MCLSELCVLVLGGLHPLVQFGIRIQSEVELRFSSVSENLSCLQERMLDSCGEKQTLLVRAPALWALGLPNVPNRSSSLQAQEVMGGGSSFQLSGVSWGSHSCPGTVRTPSNSEKGLHFTLKSTDSQGKNIFIVRIHRVDTYPWLDCKAQTWDGRDCSGMRPCFNAL